MNQCSFQSSFATWRIYHIYFTNKGRLVISAYSKYKQSFSFITYQICSSALRYFKYCQPTVLLFVFEWIIFRCLLCHLDLHLIQWREFVISRELFSSFKRIDRLIWQFVNINPYDLFTVEVSAQSMMMSIFAAMTISKLKFNQTIAAAAINKVTNHMSIS